MTKKLLAELKRDARRYRFLRSPRSRWLPRLGPPVRCMSVEVCDWGRKLGAVEGTTSAGCWSSQSLTLTSLDEELDRQIKAKKFEKVS